MYEKLMYKVQGRDNKVIFRLQDFTKNDNVDESLFVEGVNSKGAKRLECKVIVMHLNEFQALDDKVAQANADVEELQTQIKQKNVEIKKLENEIAKLKRANIDERAQLRDEKAKLSDEKFNILEEHTDEMLTMKEAHKDEVVALQNTHHKEVEKLQHDHVIELQALREQHTYDIDELKQVNVQLKQEHLTEINDIEKEHIHEIDEIKIKFLKLLANEHAQDLSDFNDCGELPFYIKPFAKGFVKSFDEFKKRKELNTPQKIVETYELAQHHDE